MSGIRLLAVEQLLLLWILPSLVGLAVLAAHRRRRSLEEFAEEALRRRARMEGGASRRWWKLAMTLTGMAFLILGLARPAWKPVEEQVEHRGRDVVFLLDVSRSMLAEDLSPNRLERAKLAILDGVERVSGDRVALVVFAGTAVVKCPLTHDYSFFRLALDDASPDSVSRGGTLIGDAIRAVMDQVFDNQPRGHRDVILITDGEDQESYPVEAARKLGELGARLIAIGLGDENQGRRIPITDDRGQRRFLTYQGQEVWSKLDAETLRKMVEATPGGRYLNVATGAVDFGDVYAKLIASAGETELGATRTERYQETFQIFLMLGFVLLAGEMLVSGRKSEAP